MRQKPASGPKQIDLDQVGVAAQNLGLLDFIRAAIRTRQLV